MKSRNLPKGWDHPFICFDPSKERFIRFFDIASVSGHISGHPEALLLPRVGHDRKGVPIYLGSIVMNRDEPMVIGQIGFNYYLIALDQSWFCPMMEEEDVLLCTRPTSAYLEVVAHYYDEARKVIVEKDLSKYLKRPSA